MIGVLNAPQRFWNRKYPNAKAQAFSTRKVLTRIREIHGLSVRSSSHRRRRKGKVVNLEVRVLNPKQHTPLLMKVTGGAPPERGLPHVVTPLVSGNFTRRSTILHYRLANDSAPPTPQMSRRKLDLLPRSDNASASPSPLSSPKMGPTPPASSRSNPFGTAR